MIITVLDRAWQNIGLFNAEDVCFIASDAFNVK